MPNGANHAPLVEEGRLVADQRAKMLEEPLGPLRIVGGRVAPEVELWVVTVGDIWTCRPAAARARAA